jgi:hypothetical protein
MGTFANLGSHGTHMTPCVIRDGELGYAPSRDHPERSCVGCGAPPEAIAEERARQAKGWTMAMSETVDEIRRRWARLMARRYGSWLPLQEARPAAARSQRPVTPVPDPSEPSITAIDQHRQGKQVRAYMLLLAYLGCRSALVRLEGLAVGGTAPRPGRARRRPTSRRASDHGRPSPWGVLVCATDRR